MVRGQRHAAAALFPGKAPVPILQEVGWVPGPVWTGAENLAPTGIRSPDQPVRSQSLYQLSYPAYLTECKTAISFIAHFKPLLFLHVDVSYVVAECAT